MIKIDNLTKKFNSFTALDKLSFEIENKGIYGFLGPNGAGKTTTLRVLAGYFLPTEGDVLINNLNIWKDLDTIRKKVGYLPENNPLYNEMRVYEFLEFAGTLQGIEKTALIEHVLSVVKICGLSEKKHALISQLSKGYRQRVGLAAALIADHDVIILDEPTEGLDPNQRLDIRELIKEIGKTKTVILSSHVLQEVEAICDHIFIINKGKIIAQGSVDDLRSQLAQTPRVTIKLIAPELPVKTVLQDFEEVTNIISSTTENGVLTVVIEVSSTRGVKNKIIQALVSHDWELQEITTSQVSLQDIFVSLTKE